jgi:integrase
VRLLDVPLLIIEKYRDERTDDRLLPICSYGKLQRLIRKLGEVYGIENLTFHKARHNFGTHITLSLGVPIETVSRMMGHRRLMTTQIYAHVTDRKVYEDTKQLRKLSASRKIELYEEPKIEQAND